jgi:two-component system response regulator RegA
MSHCVLFVDDDDVFRERLARALRERGLHVEAARDALSALALAQAGSFDSALIDLAMPGIKGMELLRKLHARFPAARLIVLTGYGSIASTLEAVRSGASDYLTKPIDADQATRALLGENRESARHPAVPSLDRVEWEHIQRVLRETGGNVSETARLLGIDRRSLQRKLGKFAPPR